MRLPVITFILYKAMKRWGSYAIFIDLRFFVEVAAVRSFLSNLLCLLGAVYTAALPMFIVSVRHRKRIRSEYRASVVQIGHRLLYSPLGSRYLLGYL